VAFVTFLSLAARPVPQAPPATRTLTASAVVGSWTATLSHAGETRLLGVTFEAIDDHTVTVKMSNPALHVHDLPIGKATIDGNVVSLAAGFVLEYDASADSLRCVLPENFVPLYKMNATFHRGQVPPEPARSLGGEAIAPVWTADAGAAVWADVTAGKDLVFAGADDGRLHALDASSGKERWTFTTGGMIRSRATITGDALYVQSDDGVLYRLDPSAGALQWKVRVSEKPVERLPPTDPKSRFNRFASAVTAGRGRLYLGTGDGHVLALDPATGARIWSFAAGDAVDSTPALDGDRLYVGSFDRSVYALNADSGTLLWKHDTGGAVVSSPAIFRDRVLVGSRSYDLLALDARTGVPAWTRYVWFSWIESPATIREGTAYVGSSDAALLSAFDATSGRTRWDLDVMGWAWGQPAVSDTRVYIGTAGAAKYPVRHQPGVLGVDRATGRVAWRFQSQAPADGTYGFPASPALIGDLVVVGGVDGRIYAFRQ
jgi:outer membrane protein assembly factor BamB